MVLLLMLRVDDPVSPRRSRPRRPSSRSYLMPRVRGFRVRTRGLPYEREALDVDMTLRALADGNRRAILRIIRSGPQPVGAVAQAVGMSQQTASHHLRTLQKAGLATVTTDHTRRLYALNTDGLAAVRSYLGGFMKVMEGHTPRATFGDDSTAVLYYFPHTPLTRSAPVSECFLVESGLIKESHLVFDRLSYTPPTDSR